MIKFLKRICSPYPFFHARKKLFRAWVALAVITVVSPALASTAEPPAASGQKYLFELSYDDAESAIGQALADKGAAKKVSANINGHRNDALFSYTKPITVEIRGLKFDKMTSRWSANLLMVAEGDVISAMPVAGRFEETVEVPVLKKQVRTGEVIGEEDIEMREFPIAHTRAGTITDTAELIGKSPSRVISAYRPIRTHEIDTPAVIRKNGIVQMRYLSPGMEISATGQAIGEGAKGEVIAVRNMTSKKVVRAVVEDQNTVTILGSDTQASQLIGAQAYETN
jgi:flagellar basal body P-ring formation protein FlgA